MIAVIQSQALAMGRWGCYEFSIMKAAEVETAHEMVDALSIHARAFVLGFIQADCTVRDAGAYMASLCGGHWVCLKAGDGRDSAGNRYDLPLDYQLKGGEHDIHRYELELEEGPGKKVSDGHFFYAGPGPLFDSCGQSNTRTDGHLVSRRILRKI